jgi:DNA-binding IclR family transcriptional regulator
LESRQIIRTTHKVLAALEALNQHQALRVSEMARLLDLPRTTTVRVLETLRDLQYIARREDDRRYHLTSRVLQLTSGFNANFSLVQAARPVVDPLCDEVRWPVTLCALSGLHMRVYYTTDLRTPHKIFTSTAGIDMPLRRTASGIVQLAFASDATRDLLLEGTREDVGAGGRTEAQIAEDVALARRQGWFYQPRSYVDRPEFRGFQDKEGLLAVPIMGRRGLVAVLACRLLRRAVKPEAIPQLLAPRLQRAAAEIAARVPDEVAIAS